MAKWTVRAKQLRDEPLDPLFEMLEPLHRPKRDPPAGDWLAVHDEPGQSVAAYRSSAPVRPERGRDTLVLQPFGELAPAQRRVLGFAASWLGAFFTLPVRVQEPLPVALVPPRARRLHPVAGNEQLLTTYLLHELLAPRRPVDAVAYLALTASDLYPGPGWSFVFGQASLTAGIGVWSLYRNGDPSTSAAALRLCVRRAAGTATHELAHMLGLLHCIAYECAMNGSNHRAEADRRPLWLCPCCLQKLCWNLSCDPRQRFARLEELARRLELSAEAAYYARVKATLGGGSRPQEPPAP